ncbi:MAG: hypothetical protein ACI936_000458 [Paraglaciecola sp.]|jgi:hypothetical protein
MTFLIILLIAASATLISDIIFGTKLIDKLVF